MELIIHKELKRQLSYNALTGIFKWKVSTNNAITIGDIAGHAEDSGYISITVNGVFYFAHRLAWFYYYGYWPENQIDHRDRIRYHNWILNLREVSNQCNQRNRGNSKNNTSGVKGVSWSKEKEKWISYVYLNSNYKNLGYYKEFDNAVCARLAGEQCVNWAGCDSESPAYLYVRDEILLRGEEWIKS